MSKLQKATAFEGKAYAKINLYLNVEGRRNDGFHTISSVMQSVSLADLVYGVISPSDKPSVTLRMLNSDIPADETNLAHRAAAAFLAASGISADVCLTVEKNIPAAAGLAGGSSDAAAVLRLLNGACGNPLSSNRLFELGATLGSDVPFCLAGGTCLCRGRGELLSPVFSPAYHYVIAVPNAKVSTPAAYRRLDALYSDFDGKIKIPRAGGDTAVLNALGQGCVALADSIFNLFEEAVLPDCPDIEGIKNAMKSAGALSTMMSGSGPSVFGIFEDREAAERAAMLVGGVAVTSTPAYEK
jgi:4-diphosphocytidyl-2-C-methyl-D-erythritol kinase